MDHDPRSDSLRSQGYRLFNQLESFPRPVLLTKSSDRSHQLKSLSCGIIWSTSSVVEARVC